MRHDGDVGDRPGQVRRRGGLLAALLVAVLLSACSSPTTPPTSRPATSSQHLAPPVPVTARTNFNRQFFFTPTPGRRHATSLTARRAWAVWANGAAVPGFETARYGRLTDNDFAHYPPKPIYRYRDQPVWAFTSAGECQPGQPPTVNGGAGATVPPPSPCTYWTVLDARTGQMVVDTAQISRG
jgi:hypothetical protein